MVSRNRIKDVVGNGMLFGRFEDFVDSKNPESPNKVFGLSNDGVTLQLARFTEELSYSRLPEQVMDKVKQSYWIHSQRLSLAHYRTQPRSWQITFKVYAEKQSRR